MERGDGSTPPAGTPRGAAPLPEASPPGLLQYQARRDHERLPAGVSGGIRLFHVIGVTVFLHWSWFLVAVYEVQMRKGAYSSIVWNIGECLALLGIVLLHEFGHALACKSVGGKANQIVLWPLGGATYLIPPPRPAPTLWSIAAGPLVNAALFPIFFYAADACKGGDPDLYTFFRAMYYIDGWLLVFNLLPVYPLDGGQILRALLWFVMGPGWSLIVAAAIGLIGAAGLALYALYERSMWLGYIAIFTGVQAWNAVKLARQMLPRVTSSRRQEAACPHCGKHPPIGPQWACGCGARFDTFETGATCPRCRQSFGVTRCVDCGQTASIRQWMPTSAVPVASLAPPSKVRHPPLPPV
ncbi:MAG: hypothetical protein JWN51_3098 [Phycisphaerales bacterium]|nr:hypothetical protein [Phycisphaerales bacterium]